MAQLAEVVGNHDDQQKYRQIAEKYVTEWIRMGEDPSNKHMKFSYNDNNTWFMIYNLYADILLETKLVPESVGYLHCFLIHFITIFIYYRFTNNRTSGI